MMHYGLAEFSDVNVFLALLARRRGMLRKGGRPDVNKAAKLVLQDWNVGRITYYSEPPETYTRSSHVTAEIVAEMSNAFDIDSLMSGELETLKGLKHTQATDIVLQSQGPTAGRIDDEDNNSAAMNAAADNAEMSGDDESYEDVESDEEEMDDDTKHPEKNVTVVDLAKSKKQKGASPATTSKAAKATAKPAVLPPGNQQLNRQRKMDFKKVKKQRKRADVVAGDLSLALTSGLSGLGSIDDSYSFATDFS
jgi:nuclear GTP-binding protein